jgi:soluble lytic murein transglycosylase
MAWGGCVGLAAALLVVAGKVGAAAAPGGGPAGDGDAAAAPEPSSRRAPDHLDEHAAAEALGIAARIAAAPTGLSRAAERALAAAIVREARAARLDPLLVAAVIEVESSFRPRAVSRAGALGLMQVMPATGAWLAAEAGEPDRGTPPHLLDPEWNVALGVRYLAHLVERFGRVEEALVAYNAGPGRARRVLSGDERARWLNGYPRRVLALRDRFRASLVARDAPR